MTEPVKTTYTWLSEDGDPLVKDEDYEETDEGVFKFLKTPEKKVLCQLSTTAFPDFKNNNIYKTTLASISEASSLDTETVEDIYINTGKNFISVINGKSQLISIYNISGIKIAEFTDSEKSIVTIQGIYIIKSENKAIKVIVE